MFARLVIGSALLLGFTTALAPTRSISDATITPAPHIELLKKQNGDGYIGWVKVSGTWRTESCATGYTYNEDSDFWGCCSTTGDACAATDRFLGCISGESIIYSTTKSGSAFRTTKACSSLNTAPTDLSFSLCNTAFMYENDRDTSPLTLVNCGVASIRWSYYRVEPTDAVTATASPTPSPIPETPTPTPTQIAPSPPGKKESKAWIAGAIIGPIAGIALIGFLAWFLIRRKKNAQPQSHGAVLPTTSTSYPQPPQSPGPPQYYPPPMQQQQDTFGALKHDSNVTPHSPNPHSPYGAAPVQQWQHPQQYDLHINQASSPSMSPHQGHAQPEMYHSGIGSGNGMFKHTGETVRPFSSELDGSGIDSQPELVTVQPKK